ncbi:Cdc6/Cdc18 family protein [Candidatus Nanohalovita haloferacivicina]|uniref:Cdc6/Cdc18 family protein n=1 Tax=Candidatus Nanohalovita haloferacivicina TaxID=2978046 RepID=UPI00325FDC81|nr:Cdc6-related protein, AAA superfamily ATPase [Candidatus Nanohalobia archaeon BNXNv]
MSFNNIIEDARVLSADYLPNKMVHRDSERQVIADNLRPILSEEQPLDMLIHGPPGTGKTAMANYVVNELHKHAMDLESGSIDCFRNPSRFEAYYQLLTDMGEFITREGTATEELVDKLEKKARKKPMVVIVDEVDQIKEESFLYDISRLNKVGVIMISNRENVFGQLDDRIQSSFSTREDIRFESYSVKELTDILVDRREYGLKPGAATRAQLEMVAEKSSGDARVAIGTLRMAARKAEREDLEEIPDRIFEESFSDAVEKNKSVSLNKLHDHQRILYNVIKEEGEVRPGDLYEEYRTRTDDPRNSRTLRRYLNKMVDYGLIEASGEKRGRKYSPAS